MPFIIHVFNYFSGVGTVTTRDEITTAMPKFREMATNVTYLRGQIATLHCFVDHLGTKTVCNDMYCDSRAIGSRYKTHMKTALT